MATQAEQELYPLSSQDGLAIPLDVAEPIAAAQIDFTSAATALLPLPATTEIIIVTATQNCWLSFGVTVPAMNNATVYNAVALVHKNYATYLRVPDGTAAVGISVKRVTADGNIKVQCIRTWRGLRQQITRF